MNAITGMMILCIIFALVSFMALSVALCLLCKDLDIDDVTIEENDEMV